MYLALYNINMMDTLIQLSWTALWESWWAASLLKDSLDILPWGSINISIFLTLFAWIIVIVRTVKDANYRSSSLWFLVLSLMLVTLLTPFIGLPIYRAIRPQWYKHERAYRKAIMTHQEEEQVNNYIVKKVTTTPIASEPTTSKTKTTTSSRQRTTTTKQEEQTAPKKKRKTPAKRSAPKKKN